MEDKKLAKMFFDACAPHIARYKRKNEGYLSGTLQCTRCSATNASRNRQRTAYVDCDNMETLCPKCQKEADEYWDEMWNEYYCSCMW